VVPNISAKIGGNRNPEASVPKSPSKSSPGKSLSKGNKGDDSDSSVFSSS